MAAPPRAAKASGAINVAEKPADSLPDSYQELRQAIGPGAAGLRISVPRYPAESIAQRVSLAAQNEARMKQIIGTCSRVAQGSRVSSELVFENVAVKDGGANLDGLVIRIRRIPYLGSRIYFRGPDYLGHETSPPALRQSWVKLTEPEKISSVLDAVEKGIKIAAPSGGVCEYGTRTS